MLKNRQLDGRQRVQTDVRCLALESKVDILPLYLGGTYESMAKGSFLPTKDHGKNRPSVADLVLQEALQDIRTVGLSG